jgi:hypothetical protein
MRVALTKKPKNKFELIGLSSQRLKEYGLHPHYILSACEVAYSAYKNKKRRSNPYFRKPFLKLDNQTYKLNYLLLRIPIGQGDTTISPCVAPIFIAHSWRTRV